MASGKKKRPIRVGIIGCGDLSARHFRAAQEAPEVKLVACCDRDKGKARAAAAKYGCRAFRSYRRMIRWCRLDAVHICLPYYQHTVTVGYSLSKKLHVLSEKPMAATPGEADRLVSLAKKVGKTYSIVLRYRNGAPARLVREALETGRLGKLFSVRATLAVPADDCESHGKEGGRILFDEAVHVLDLFGSILGSEALSAFCTLLRRGEEWVGTTNRGPFFYEDGAHYSFYCVKSRSDEEPIEIRLTCERGEAVLTRERAKITYYSRAAETATEKKAAIYPRLVGQFYRACLGGAEPEVSGADVLAAHRLAFRLCEDTGKEI